MEVIWFYNTLCEAPFKRAMSKQMFELQFCPSYSQKKMTSSDLLSAVWKMVGSAGWIATFLLLHWVTLRAVGLINFYYNKYGMSGAGESWYSLQACLHITWTQSGPDDVIALCIINIERSFPQLGSCLYHRPDSISNLPHNSRGLSYCISERTPPHSVVKFYFLYSAYRAIDSEWHFIIFYEMNI